MTFEILLEITNNSLTHAMNEDYEAHHDVSHVNDTMNYEVVYVISGSIKGHKRTNLCCSY